MGKDHTLYALCPGVVFFHRATKFTPRANIERRYISVIPFEKANDADFINQIVEGPRRAYQELHDSQVAQEKARLEAPDYERLPIKPKGIDAPFEELEN